MVELILGIIWTSIVGVVVKFGFYGTQHVTINNKIYSHEEVSAMLGPKIFFGIFFAIGFFLIFKGIITIVRENYRNINGEDCFGKVCNVYNSNLSKKVLKVD